MRVRVLDQYPFHRRRIERSKRYSGHLASLLDDDLRERFPRGLDRLAVRIRGKVRNEWFVLAEQPHRAQLVDEFLFRHGRWG